MVKLIRSNLHKDRAVVIVFMLIIMIAAMLMHTSLLINTYDEVYDKKAQDINIPDAIEQVRTDDDIDDIIKSCDMISDYSVTDMILPAETVFTVNSSKKEITNDTVLFYEYGSQGIAGEHNFIERDESVSGIKIYLNLGLAKSNGINTGDKIHLKMDYYDGLEFTVAGIYEDLFNGVGMSYNSVMLDKQGFEQMKECAEKVAGAGKTPQTNKLVYMRFAGGVVHKDGLKQLREAVSAKGYYNYGYTMELAREAYVGIISLLVPFLSTFALLMIVICIIMIIFAISNNISRDIRNIGALRAVGHTVGQIRTSLTLEYLLIGTISTAAGTALSYLLFPILEKAFLRGLTGIVCETVFRPSATFGVILGILLAIVATAFIASARIKKLHPATALRFGLSSNSFKRNHFPLADTRGGLNLLLSAKSAVQSMGQSISIFVVIVTVSFLTFFSLMMFYNTKIDSFNFQRLLQGDVPDGLIEFSGDEAKRQEIIKELKTIDGVSQAYSLTFTTATINGDDIDTLMTAEPECVYCGIYEGRMCEEANETVIGGELAKRLGVKVGDEIKISNIGREERYLVTGLQQAVYSLGERAYITDEGAKRIGIEPNHSIIRIRMTDPTAEKVDTMLEKAQQLLGSECVSIDNYYRYQRSEDNLPVFAVGMINVIFILLSLVTVFLIIRLLLKTVFIKREKEFGIKKAMGFTSHQLRLQLSLSLLLPAVAAAVLGSVGGFFLVNPLFNVVFSSYGIKNSDLIAKPMMIAVTALSVLVLVFVLSFIMSRKMKKVAAYKLISE